MNIWEIISAIVSVITLFSIIGIVLQYTKKREMAKDLFQMVLTQYNNYYLIARAMTRVHKMETSARTDKTKLQKVYDHELSFILGVADSARIELMNFSKNQLNKAVFYQHPAYPEKKDFTDSIKMGVPPEMDKSVEQVEIAKKIMMNKRYLIEMQKNESSDQDEIIHFTVLNEEYGGIPGSNIGITYYSNTQYTNLELYDDQVFFYVLEGRGKAKIGNCEIELSEHSMFVVPPKTEHALLSDDFTTPIKVLWTHNPIK